MVKGILLMGGTLEFGRLSIAPLDKVYKFGAVGTYQVHCDDSRYRFSDIFDDIDKAVHWFVKIGKEINAFNNQEPDYTVPPVPAVRDDAGWRNSRSGPRKPQRKNSFNRGSIGS
jgi:hypothetical protein